MPRNVRYRKQFQAQNDLYWRLDLIPGDDTVFDYASAGTVILGDETVLSISDIALNYRDDLCFGFPEYEPLAIEFNLDTIPTDLKTYLATGFKPGTELTDLIASNIAILWSSSNNITYTPIWVGVQTPQLVSEITVSSRDASTTKITFQPIQTTVLVRSKWSLLNKYFDDPDTFEFRDVSFYMRSFAYSHWNWAQDVFAPYTATVNDFPTVNMRLTNEFDNASEDENNWIYPYPLKNVFEVMRREMQAWFKYLTRQATSVVRTGADKTTNYFDWEYNRYVGADGVIKVRKVSDFNNVWTRLGDYCTFNELFVPMIIDPGDASNETYILRTNEWIALSDTNQTSGGIFNANDAGSFAAQYKTYAEFMSAISEWACSKMLINFSFASNRLKMTFEVFGALEKTNTTLPVTLKLFEITASESLTAEIGYICSSVETGNAAATNRLVAIKAQSPVLSDLAKSQSFNIKNSVFSWDVNINEPLPSESMKPSAGTFEDQRATGGAYRGFLYKNQGPIPCTTLFSGQGLIKVIEYMQAGDTTKAISEDLVYYETDNFDEDAMKDLFVVSGPLGFLTRYLTLYRWMLKWQLLTGTAVQFNKLFSKILTNARNWMVRDAEIYHIEQVDLGMPHRLLGHKIENDIPIAYDPLLDLANKGIITNVKYEILTGKYTLGTFQIGFLME